ncbi:MAG TPA: hypothetical protein VFI23_14055 [Rhizomicrobium sp.]|nr:hypothetical protein [Rhizomicrobium sp.]
MVEPIRQNGGTVSGRSNTSISAWRPAIVVVAILLHGCAAPIAPEDSAAHYVLENGSNEISGRVAIISSNGHARPCDVVSLLPVTPFWTGWRNQIFDSDKDYAARFAIQSVFPDPAAQPVARHSDCDSSGRFRFAGIADGKYYVFSTVLWLLRWQHNGGGFMREVEVRGGQSVGISLVKDWREPAHG